MAPEQRKRTDARGEATRTALIEAAESLFAQAGVDAVSTRQIGAAIGSSNTNVVAYHFGSKEALIRAVYRHRLPQIDRRRRELFDEAREAGACDDVRTLVRAFFLPLFEQVDEQGRHSYARFLIGLENSGLIGTREEVSAEFPETVRLTIHLRDSLPAALRADFGQRLRLAGLLVFNALLQIDREGDGSGSQAPMHFENAVSMASAALSAPPTGDA